MTPAQMLKLVQQPESEWLEFKHDNIQFEQIGRNMAAISNTLPLLSPARQRGYIVWGVENPNQNIVGTRFNPRREKRGNEELENWLLQHLQPKINFHIHEAEVDNKKLVVFEIYPATHQPTSFSGTRYIRVGSYTKNLNNYPEKERALWNCFASTPFEEGVAFEKATPEQVLELIDFTTYIKKINHSFPDNRQLILKLLEQNQIIQARNSSGLYDISNLGAVLFASDLQKFSRLIRKSVRVIVYNGNNKTCDAREKQFDAGYIVEFDNIIEYIDNQIEKTEKITKALREETTAYPIAAVRELVANAIIHQNFFEPGVGGPRVEIFSNRITISNAGKPLINVLRFIDEESQVRNEKMARFARRMRISEDRGTGIDKVISNAEKHLLTPPQFRATDTATIVTLFAHKNFADMTTDERVRACYQHACLRYLSGNELTNASLRARFGVDNTGSTSVSKVIKKTADQNLIKSKSTPGKTKPYIPFWA